MNSTPLIILSYILPHPLIPMVHTLDPVNRFLSITASPPSSLCIPHPDHLLSPLITPIAPQLQQSAYPSAQPNHGSYIFTVPNLLTDFSPPLSSSDSLTNTLNFLAILSLHNELTKTQYINLQNAEREGC